MYMYVSAEDRITKRKVEDKEVNTEFQEALKYCPSLMIEEHTAPKRVKSGFFYKTVSVTFFQIYHETPAHDGTAYQARYQNSGSGDKRIVIAYLHGIINSESNRKEQVETAQPQQPKEEKETKNKIASYIKSQMNLLPNNATPSQRAGYDSYLNILNYINNIEEEQPSGKVLDECFHNQTTFNATSGIHKCSTCKKPFY